MLQEIDDAGSLGDSNAEEDDADSLIGDDQGIEGAWSLKQSYSPTKQTWNPIAF